MESNYCLIYSLSSGPVLRHLTESSITTTEIVPIAQNTNKTVSENFYRGVNACICMCTYLTIFLFTGLIPVYLFYCNLYLDLSMPSLMHSIAIDLKHICTQTGQNSLVFLTTFCHSVCRIYFFHQPITEIFSNIPSRIKCSFLFLLKPAKQNDSSFNQKMMIFFLLIYQNICCGAHLKHHY